MVYPLRCSSIARQSWHSATECKPRRRSLDYRSHTVAAHTFQQRTVPHSMACWSNQPQLLRHNRYKLRPRTAGDLTRLCSTGRLQGIPAQSQRSAQGPAAVTPTCPRLPCLTGRRRHGRAERALASMTAARTRRLSATGQVAARASVCDLDRARQIGSGASARHRFERHAIAS